MSKMLRCSFFTYLLLSLLVVFHVYGQDPVPVHTAVTSDGTVRKGINRVLSLDGDGDYVEMADSAALDDIGSQVTVEVWIRATAFSDQWITIINKADESGPPDWRDRSYVLTLNSTGFIELASAPSGQGNLGLNSPVGLIALNTWYHVAGVVDTKNGVMRIFINGAEVARGDSGKNIHVSKLPLRVGWRHGEDRFPFEGWIDEVRIWSVAHTQEEIREKMHTTLSGREPGLVGYWRFDDRADMVTDSSPNQTHGKLMGDAHIVKAELPRPDELDIPTVISGTVRDELGNPMGNIIVRLVQSDVEIAQETTDSLGQYRMFIPRLTGGLYDLFATSGTRGQMLLDISLHKGESRSLDLVLREAISIQGTLMMLDNATPHVAVPVQAIRNGKVMATALSNEGGRYQLFNLKPGRYQVRCQVRGGYVYYGKGDRGEREGEIGGEEESDILRVEHGKTLRSIDFRFAPFKKGTWRNYSSFDGLPYNVVRAIYRDPDGTLWVGTGWHGHLGGVSHYDGTKFVTLSSQSGLTPNNVSAIHRDPNGVMWFATDVDGVFRYDGEKFDNFTTQDGLAHDRVQAMHRDADGVMWFATLGGASRYDGKEFVNFTTEDGLPSNSVVAIHGDSDGVVWFATSNGVSRYDGKEFVNFTTVDGLADNNVACIHRDPDGVMWFGTGSRGFGGGGGGVSRYDGKKFVNFTTKDGLPSNCVLAIHRDPDGVLWFGTDNGVSRYDGTTFANFTIGDGLAHNVVFTIYTDTDGAMWFGTGGGLSRYDEEGMANFTTIDGLVHNDVWTLYRVSDDILWVGTMGGASRFDGRSFTNFTAKDGLVSNRIRAIHLADDGVLWFGTWGWGICLYDGNKFIGSSTMSVFSNDSVFTIYRDPDDIMWFGTSDGVVRYDGEQFVRLDTALVYNDVVPIVRMPDGIMWFGTSGGASRYDGKEFTNFTTVNGLVNDDVNAMLHEPDGLLWFGTAGGLSRYDGQVFTNLTTEDGLIHDSIRAIHRDSNGLLWFGTEGGGVCVYDGTAWSGLDTRDGLAGDEVRTIGEDSDGYLWFGTDGGITRYRRSTEPPKAHIVSVTTDQTYRLKTQLRHKTQDARLKTEESSIPAFTTGTRVTIEYSAIDFKTIPEKRQYRSRIHETGDLRLETSRRGDLDSTVSSLKSDVPYNPPTKDSTFDWTPEEAGIYTFQVQAIDRDLNYSEPASLTLKVVSPFYMSAVFLVSVIGAGSILLLVSIISLTAYTKRRRQVHAYQQLAVQELQDAREMQLSLLPGAAPPVEGMEIAGRSVPANTVGGDFFDYLSLPDGKVGIAMADVSGKGLRAAMNAVLASGMLYEVVKAEVSCGRILSALNGGLHPRMEKQMFTAFSFAILDEDAGMIQWSNAAQPLPLIKRSDGASEVEEGGELPLGMAPDVEYPDCELKLQAGDLAIFYTDGIIEAENETEEMYGTERLVSLVAGMDSAASAEDAIEAILQDVAQFAGDAEQYDDMTVVVVKKL